MIHNKIIVYDGHSKVPPDGGTVVQWRGYSQKPNEISLLKFIDENSDRLRSKYLKFIRDLGDSKLGSQSVTELMAFDESFSLWWMSLLAEKSPFKSSRVLDCLRLFALEEVFENQAPESLEFYSADEKLSSILEKFCQSQKISYKFFKVKKTFRTDKNLFINFVPHWLSAVLYLVFFVVSRWVLKRKPLKQKLNSNRVVIVTNFFNLDPDRLKENSFYPKQWEALPDFLNTMGVGVNFLHHFLYSPEIRNPETANHILEKIILNSGSNTHQFIDGAISIKVLARVLWKWLALVKRLLFLRSVNKVFVPERSKFNFWPILKDEWTASLVGKPVIQNLFWLELFSEILKNLPSQKLCLYLCENQPWEMALVSAWKKHKLGEIVAVPHSTVRFWDLRYFYDPRVFCPNLKYQIPVADKIAVNGEMAYKNFIEGGISSRILYKVEALRYQYLAKHNNLVVSRDDGKFGLSNSKILILGDYKKESTLKMLALLDKATRMSNKNFSFTIKPHPVCQILPADAPNLHLEVTRDSIESIISSFDIVFVSNTTSASLDAYLAGKSVVVYLDEDDFNFSPLRGVSGVWFVSDEKELEFALSLPRTLEDKRQVKDFFWVNSEMPMWSELLRSSVAKNNFF